MRHDALSRLAPWLLAALLLLGAGLRLYHLGAPELQWDEFLVLNRAQMPLPALVDSLNHQSAADVFQDTSPPLHHVLAHLALAVADSDFFARLPAALCGTLSLLALYLAARPLTGRRAALFAALYGCVLQFHLFYSRYMRWYAFFYLFSLLTLWTYQRLLARTGWKNALAFTFFAALTLYSSYIALPFLAALGLFGLGLAAWERWCGRSWAAALRPFCVQAACLAGALLLYAPQIPGQIVAYHTFYAGGGNAVDIYRLGKALREITLYFRESELIGLGGVLLFSGLGLAAMAAGRRWRQMLLLGAWCGLPTLAAFAVNVQTQITAKYLPGMFYFVVITAPAGAVFLAELLLGRLAPARLSARPWPALVLGAGLTMFLAWPNLELGPFYRGWPRTYTDWGTAILLRQNTADAIMFDSNRGRKVMLTRELDKALPTFATAPDAAYTRFFFVSRQGNRVPPNLVAVQELPQAGETIVLSRGGVLRRSPIEVVPGPDGLFRYHDDFRNLTVYETCARAANMAPDFTAATLAAYDLSAPGRVVYRFSRPSGVSCSSLTVRARVVLRSKIRFHAPDAALRLEAGPDPKALAPVAVADFDAFAAANSALRDPQASGDFRLDLSRDVPWDAPGDLYLALAIDPGRYAAYLEVEDLEITGQAMASGPLPDPAVSALSRLAGQVRFAAWDPDAWPVGGHGLFAFQAGDTTPVSTDSVPAVGSPGDLARFRLAHPGLPPVAVLNDAQGRPAFLIYDSWLDRDGLPLSPGRAVTAQVEQALPWTPRGILLAGAVTNPVLAVDGRSFPIPLTVPQGSRVLLNPGGLGLVETAPLFTPQAFSLANMVRRDNLLALEDGRLTCLEKRPCAFGYVYSSQLPIKGLRVTVFPSLATDAPRHIRVTCAPNDPAAVREVLAYATRGPGPWSGAPEGLRRQVLFDREVKVLFVNFELSGPGAFLRSDAGSPLRIEVLLDASSLAAPVFTGPTARLVRSSPDADALDIGFSDAPLPVSRLWERR